MNHITTKAQRHLLMGGMAVLCWGTTFLLPSSGVAQPQENRSGETAPQPTGVPVAPVITSPPSSPAGSPASPAPLKLPPVPKLQAPPTTLPSIPEIVIAPESTPSPQTPQKVVLPPVPSKSTRAVGPITGTGTKDNLAKFTGTNAIGNSVLVEKGGKIGLGTTSPTGLLSVAGSSSSTPSIYASNSSSATAISGTSSGGSGVYGYHSSASGDTAAILGETNSTSANGTGVRGVVKPTSPGASSAGVRGINQSTNTKGFGVYGSHAGGGVGVLGDSANGIGVRGRHTATSGTDPAVFGETNSTSDNAVAVQGTINSTSPGGSSAAVRGINKGTGGSGSGVYGSHAGSGFGVYGQSVTGYGVVGTSSNLGVYGNGTNYGVFGSSGSYGVYGSGSYGVYGSGSTNGVYGSGSGQAGVYGISSSQRGVWGKSTDGFGVQGESSTNVGIVAYSNSNYGVYGHSVSRFGVYGDSDQSIGVYGRTANSSSQAGYFQGNVYVNGNLAKASGSFKIDNPLHPATEYLSHSFVESPDMMNVYNGNVTLDAKGQATVQMPDYFQALNSDFRYQLTPIGAPASLYVAKEISGNHFSIAGGKAGMKVSWQVTGIRQDAYARDHRIKVEETKSTADQGKYLYPAGFGAGEDKQIGPNVPRLAAR